jgi:hypothetical protein
MAKLRELPLNVSLIPTEDTPIAVLTQEFLDQTVRFEGLSQLQLDYLRDGDRNFNNS